MQLEETSKNQQEHTEQQYEFNALDLQSLDKEQLVKIILERRFSGPIPPPEILGMYDQAVSGAAGVILDMAQSEQKHRHNQENRQLDEAAKDNRTGLWLAFFITIIAIGAGTTIIVFVPGTGPLISGSLLNLVGITNLVSAFINGKQNQKEDEE